MLREGATAIKSLSEPHPKSMDDLLIRLKMVMTGALVLQSLNNLRSDEENKQIRDDILRLQEEAGILQKKIDLLKTP